MHDSDPTAANKQAPPDYRDPVIEAYKQHVDRSLLRENLKLSVDARFRKFRQFMRQVGELRDAGRRARGESLR
jgi:hypothetical protein